MIAVRRAGVRSVDRGLDLVVDQPARLDLALATGALIALEFEVLTSPHRQGPLLLNVAATALMALAALWRRRAPLLSLAAIGAGAVALHAGLTAVSANYGTLAGLYCVLVPTYAVGAWAPRGRAIAGLALWILVAGAILLLDSAPPGELVPASVTALAIWGAGRVMRTQRLLAEDLDRTLARLRAERAERARLAAAGERLRIARELHAIVTRSVTAMVVQAEAAGALLPSDPAATDRALREVEASGREALGEMRRILGILRRAGAAHEVQPQPGVGDLAALVQRHRERGRRVDLRVVGEPGPLPTGAELAAYRIVEDALAGPAAPGSSLTIAVTIAEGLDLCLEAGGPARPPEWPSAVMQEWVELCGGRLTRGGDPASIRIRVAFPEPGREQVE